MHNLMRVPASTVGSVLLLLSVTVPRLAAQVFTIDTNLSSVAISGTVLGGAISSQGPGSLTAAIGGTIQAVVAGSTIQFSGQSEILALNSGDWQPKSDGTSGSEPANYGGQASLGFASGVAALRQIQLDVISPPITVMAGQFESTNLTFLFPSNSLSSIAYNVTGLVNTHGSVQMTGYGTNKVTALASLDTSGAKPVLTIPVDATFSLKLLSANDTVVRLQGQLVAVQGGEAPLSVESVLVQSQSILLQWQASPGTQFQIQSSTDLAQWITNTTLVTPASGSYTWTGAISGLLQFYRLAKP